MELVAKRQLDDLLVHGLIVLALAVLTSFSTAYFSQVPYAGFNFNRGRIHAVYVTATPGAELQVGDELVQVGPVSWPDFAADLRQTLFDEIAPGQVVPILVRRDGELVGVPWLFPGFNRRQFLARLLSAWWLPYIFWFFAALTVLLVRPKDGRWWLLVAFNLLTAVWLAAGSGPSGWHVWHSALILRATIWLSLPVYWHLHWLFPDPLKPLPGFVFGLAYLGGGTLAVLEWLQRLPQDAYLIGFTLAITGSLILLIAHTLFRPEQRRRLRLPVKVATLVFLPTTGVVIAGLFGGDLRWASLILLGLPFIPGAYLYTIYYHQPGKLHLRANRLIALYAYLILVGPVVAMTLTLLAGVTHFSESPNSISLIAAMVMGGLTIAIFSPFARFIEHHVLGMPYSLASLLENYAMRIATRPDKASLVKLLRDEVLPSLLVRHSALVLNQEDQAHAVLLKIGVEEDDLPRQEDMPALLAQAGIHRPVNADRSDRQPYPWARLILPLTIGEKPMGLWLLGRRDPDDFYSQAEIATLQALAAQTAVALANITQTENLHALYQTNIDREERARTNLALTLHDEILTQMTAVAMFVDKETVPPQFHRILESLMARCREIVYGLRPATLNYGLAAALRDLGTSLAERSQSSAVVQFDLPATGHRYPERVEQHLYRIVQQAVENALQHASAQKIYISGRLEAEQISLSIEDDGKGFAAELPGVSLLLARKQFGLAGMVERASLIGAEVQIVSAPGQGTQVRVLWSSSNEAAWYQ